MLVDGAQCFCRRVTGSEYKPCRRTDIPHFFADASDVITVSGKSPEQAFRILENECANDRCLHLILILLDQNAHLRAKRLASEVLDSFLSKHTPQQFVLHRLYSRSLPPSADPPTAINLALESGAKLLWDLLTRLRADQPSIAAVRERWDSIDAMVIGDFQDKNAFEQVAIEEGLFYGLCAGKIAGLLPVYVFIYSEFNGV